jgi:VCBS repeat-containing protein
MLDGTNSLKKFQITEFNFGGGAGPITINADGPWTFAMDAGKKSVRLIHTALFSCHCSGSSNLK